MRATDVGRKWTERVIPGAAALVSAAMRLLAAILATLAACSGGDAVPTPASPTSPPPVPVATTPPPATVPDAAAVAAAPVDAAPPEPLKGYDFIDDANVLYRVVGCGHLDQPLPDRLTHGDADRTAKLQRVIDKHCATLAPQMAKYREDYFGTARAWFVDHQPKDLPKTVVYAFAGGDLVSALVAFPDATEITTLSLELAGDPRKIDTLAPEQLEHDLAGFRNDIGTLISVGSNLSVNLSDEQRLVGAGQLSQHLLGLATGGYEPVSVRFFTLGDDGSIHYLEKDEIDADTKSGKPLSGAWKAPAFAQSFANVEIRYRAIGSSDVRVHRHIAWNLADDYLKKHDALMKHLDSKGKVAICVKGSSYLLWHEGFGTFRQYLIDHLAWMVTDSTGLAPNFAPDTLQQDAYGQFDGPMIKHAVGLRADSASRKKWKTPKDKMPFRFGYPDVNGHNHVMITTPKS